MDNPWIVVVFVLLFILALTLTCVIVRMECGRGRD
jgi:hypothetical protein